MLVAGWLFARLVTYTYASPHQVICQSIAEQLVTAAPTFTHYHIRRRTTRSAFGSFSPRQRLRTWNIDAMPPTPRSSHFTLVLTLS